MNQSMDREDDYRDKAYRYIYKESTAHLQFALSKQRLGVYFPGHHSHEIIVCASDNAFAWSRGSTLSYLAVPILFV